MNIPAFTAEASLYKTSGHYRTGRHRINSSAQTGSPVRPAAREQEGEIINVHGCPPGSIAVGEQPNITCVFIPGGGAGGGNGGIPPGGGPEDGGPLGGGGQQPPPLHFKVCGPCVSKTPQDFALKVGQKHCYDMYCQPVIKPKPGQPRPPACWKTNERDEPCIQPHLNV
jgi:hypothetical protein